MPRTIYTADHVRLIALLRSYRERAGLRQVDLAERLDRPQSFVSDYERGQRRLDLIELDAVCNALGISVVTVVRRWHDGRPALAP
ncbi:MAG: helix-turn-helix transcriptional regulator [Ilumatobacteraceae bacterium]